MKKLYGIELDDKQFDFLMCEQAKGKILKVIDGQLQAIDYKPTEKELYNQELNELKGWYDCKYTYKEQKFRRLHSLGKLTDEGTNPYDELIKLYKVAETNRARIQELERLLSDSAK